MEVKKIEVTEWTLPKLLINIEGGVLRIPKFQREFVWSRPQTIKLLDSIYKEYPIGSLFFWYPSDIYKNMYREIPELQQQKASRSAGIQLILDGQQRITSIYAVSKGLTINGTDYSRIVFDLEKKVFAARSPDNDRFISFQNIVDDNEKYYEISDGLPHEKRKILQKCSSRFKNYPFSIVEVYEKSLEEVCDIFERINQGGKRLTLFDLLVAATWSDEFDLRTKVKEYNEKSEQKGFGVINPDVFIQALALIIKGQCTRKIQLELTTKDLIENWDNLIASLDLAIDYLIKNMGVYKFDMIPYPGLLVMFTYLFAKIKGRSLSNSQSEESERWFWNTTLSERYGASSLTNMTEDRKKINKITEDQQISSKLPVNVSVESLMQIKMGQTSAIKNAVLCLLALKKPLHFENAVVINVDDRYFSDYWSTEKHHIFPKKFLAKKGINLSDVNYWPNFCFIPSELNKKILDSEPKKYFSMYRENKEFKKIMRSHLIPIDEQSGIWTNDYRKFLTQRAELILKELKKLYQ